MNEQGQEWYVLINNKKIGPKTSTEMKSFYAQHIIDDETLVWAPSLMGDWVPLSKSNLIPPPPPGSSPQKPQQTPTPKLDKAINFVDKTQFVLSNLAKMCFGILVLIVLGVFAYIKFLMPLEPPNIINLSPSIATSKKEDAWTAEYIRSQQKFLIQSGSRSIMFTIHIPKDDHIYTSVILVPREMFASKDNIPTVMVKIGEYSSLLTFSKRASNNEALLYGATIEQSEIKKFLHEFTSEKKAYVLINDYDAAIDLNDTTNSINQVLQYIQENKMEGYPPPFDYKPQSYSDNDPIFNPDDAKLENFYSPPNLSLELSTLFKKAAYFRDKCQGVSGDDPRSEKLCSIEADIDKRIEAAGWCYGDPNDPSQIEADKTWIKCNK